MEEALGVLCKTLADSADRSVLDQFRTTICESVDSVLLALVDAMESDDEISWDLARRLTGDRGKMMGAIRTKYLERDPPLQHLELIDVLLITNSVEEAFFLFSKLENEFNPNPSGQAYVPKA